MGKKGKKTRLSRVQQWLSRFRAIFVFRGIARRQRRHQERQRRAHYRSQQYEIDKQRRAARIKAHNRARRRNTRTLHQAQRKASR